MASDRQFLVYIQRKSWKGTKQMLIIRYLQEEIRGILAETLRGIRRSENLLGRHLNGFI